LKNTTMMILIPRFEVLINHVTTPVLDRLLSFFLAFCSFHRLQQNTP